MRQMLSISEKRTYSYIRHTIVKVNVLRVESVMLQHRVPKHWFLLFIGLRRIHQLHSKDEDAETKLEGPLRETRVFGSYCPGGNT